jgi:AcrR family transcriptional regulator
MQEKGYGGISAQDIADALEFSKANFFYHVRSKEDLLYHIFVDTYQFAIRHYEEILARELPAVEKLRALIEFYVRLMTEHGAVMQIWFKERAHLTPEHEAEAMRFERRIQALLGDFYTDAIRRGEFRDVDPRLAAVSMFGMCFALTKWPELTQRLSMAELTEQMQQLAYGALVRKQR